MIRHYHGHLSAVHCISLHPTIDVLVTGGRDSSARVSVCVCVCTCMCVCVCECVCTIHVGDDDIVSILCISIRCGICVPRRAYTH